MSEETTVETPEPDPNDLEPTESSAQISAEPEGVTPQGDAPPAAEEPEGSDGHAKVVAALRRERARLKDAVTDLAEAHAKIAQLEDSLLTRDIATLADGHNISDPAGIAALRRCAGPDERQALARLLQRPNTTKTPVNGPLPRNGTPTSATSTPIVAAVWRPREET